MNKVEVEVEVSHYAGRKKLENQKLSSIFNFELKIKWTNDPRTIATETLDRTRSKLMTAIARESIVSLFPG